MESLWVTATERCRKDRPDLIEVGQGKAACWLWDHYQQEDGIVPSLESRLIAVGHADEPPKGIVNRVTQQEVA